MPKTLNNYRVVYVDKRGREWRTVIDAQTAKAAGNKIRRGGAGRKIRRVTLLFRPPAARAARRARFR